MGVEAACVCLSGAALVCGGILQILAAGGASGWGSHGNGLHYHYLGLIDRGMVRKGYAPCYKQEQLVPSQHTVTSLLLFKIALLALFVEAEGRQPPCLVGIKYRARGQDRGKALAGTGGMVKGVQRVRGRCLVTLTSHHIITSTKHLQATSVPLLPHHQAQARHD